MERYCVAGCGDWEKWKKKPHYIVTVNICFVIEWNSQVLTWVYREEMLVSKLVGEDGGLSGGCRGLSNRLEAHFGAFWAYSGRLDKPFGTYLWGPGGPFWGLLGLSKETGGPFLCLLCLLGLLGLIHRGPIRGGWRPILKYMEGLEAYLEVAEAYPVG